MSKWEARHEIRVSDPQAGRSVPVCQQAPQHNQQLTTDVAELPLDLGVRGKTVRCGFAVWVATVVLVKASIGQPMGYTGEISASE